MASNTCPDPGPGTALGRDTVLGSYDGVIQGPWGPRTEQGRLPKSRVLPGRAASRKVCSRWTRACLPGLEGPGPSVPCGYHCPLSVQDHGGGEGQRWSQSRECEGHRGRSQRGRDASSPFLPHSRLSRPSTWSSPTQESGKGKRQETPVC